MVAVFLPRRREDREAASPRLMAYGVLPAACCCLLLLGCGPSPNATFVVSMEGRDPTLVTRSDCAAIRETMAVFFGRPDRIPDQLPEGVALDRLSLVQSAGPIRGDAAGRQSGLYRQHCAACHGLAGDGAGSFARLLRPYPCDFRLGLFKYTSTCRGGRPARADIERTRKEGIPATAMPRFDRLPQSEISSLVDYVIFLSIRGEVERAVAQLILDEGEYLPLADDLVHEEAIAPVAQLWSEAQSLVVDPEKALAAEPPMETPAQRAASIARGRKLYLSNDSQCTKCPGPEGRGDGEQRELYDAANRPKLGVSEEQTRRLAKRFTLPLQRLRARNFHEGIFRGGRRPIDVYWRIHVGIKGTPMPASGPDQSTPGVFSPAEIWDVVHFVLSLSGK